MSNKIAYLLKILVLEMNLSYPLNLGHLSEILSLLSVDLKWAM